ERAAASAAHRRAVDRAAQRTAALPRGGAACRNLIETSGAKRMRRPIASRRESAEQPFKYPLERAFAEPDWTRLPGYRKVTRADWESALWQRKNTVKSLAELKEALGKLLPDDLAAGIERDQRERATMSLLITPHMINTLDERDLSADPLLRYMLPAFGDRRTDWPSHPRASRDSLHESVMWVVEGLTHRYPTKVLAEMLSTCPQYCGHCTRMDLVGHSVPPGQTAPSALAA